MKLLVTGAGGFLGRYVVASALERGHTVRALLRPASSEVPETWKNHPRLERICGDLRSSNGISAMLAGMDGIIHLAASKAGDLYEQFGGTVLATENLLTALGEAGVKRLVVTSSFSVYEYEKRWAWSVLDEASPLSADPFVRDEYCQTKLVQERLVLDKAQKEDWRCIILRPGVIYGPYNLWTARLGIQISNQWWIRTGTFAPLPLTHVENCAEAIVLAAEYNGPEHRIVLNLVDDETPSQRAYLKELQHQTIPRPRIIPIPWTVMRFLARCAWLINRLFFKGTAKVPGILVPSRLHARCKPLKYTNHKIRSVLGWRPKFSWKEGIRRSMGDG